MQEEKINVSSPFSKASPVAFINHALRGQPWALERLKPYAGKAAQFRVAPFSFDVTILDSGEFSHAAQGVVPDVALSFSPGVLLRILAADDAALSDVVVRGDTALASEIGYIARNVRWDVEEDLSRIFGDIVAHRLVKAGEKLLEWRKQSFWGLAQTLVEYWTEEQPLLAKPKQVHTFIKAVDVLRDDTERVEKRIAKLEGRS